MHQMPGPPPPIFPEAPRYLGLSLIFCGVAALVSAIWEHHWGLSLPMEPRLCGNRRIYARGKQTPLLAVAVLALVGVFAFFAVLLRLL
jgi:putative membrane protein